MNLAVIGSGGREHAICYKLKQSTKINKLVCIPGNAGTKKLAINISTDLTDFESLYQIIKEQKIDIVVIKNIGDSNNNNKRLMIISPILLILN